MELINHRARCKIGILSKLSITLTAVLAVVSWGSHSYAGGMVQKGGMGGAATSQTSNNLNLTNPDCKNCHLGSIPDKHHALPLITGKQCLDCHKMVTDGSGYSYTIEVVRDCVVCHGIKMHDTVQHTIKSCVGCHHHSGTIEQIHTGWRYSGADTLTICKLCHSSTVPRVQQTIARGVAGQVVACTDCHPNPHKGRVGGMGK